MIRRSVLCGCLVVAAVACTHGDRSGCEHADGGACIDASSAGQPAADGGAPMQDASTPPPDAGEPAPMDAASDTGQPAADGGKPARDAGAVDRDEDSGHTDAGTHADEDAGPIDRDGTYTCQPITSFAYDCVDPWFDATYQRPDAGTMNTWMLQLTNGHLTLDSYGYDQAVISCDGSWSDDEFTCAAQWSRAGRVCDNPLHLRAQPDGTLIFSVAMRTEELAGCHK